MVWAPETPPPICIQIMHLAFKSVKRARHLQVGHAYLCQLHNFPVPMSLIFEKATTELQSLKK